MPRDRVTSRSGWARRSDRPSVNLSKPGRDRPASTVRSGYRWCGSGTFDLLWWLLWWPLVYRVDQSGPQMLDGVGAPGAPPSADFAQFSLVVGQPQLLGGQPEAKVAGGKGIGVPEAAHGDHLCSPWADPGQRQQLSACTVPVAPCVKGDAAVGEARDQSRERALPCFGDGQMDGIDIGQ